MLEFFKNLFKSSGNFANYKESNLIVVDVDNTISPNRYGGVKENYYSDWNGAHSISSELFEDIESLPGDKAWLTSWVGDAEDTFKRKWLVLPWLNEDSYYEWKLNSLTQFLKDNSNYKKVVWMDDDLEKWRDKVNFPEGVKVHYIVPKDYKGISREDVSEARRFLEE